MVLTLLWLAAFVSAVALVFGLALGGAALIVRHPKARLEFERRQGEVSWLVRVLDLAVEVATPRLEGRRWNRFRQRIALDLRRLGPSAVPEPDRFVARALLEGLALGVLLVGLSAATLGRPMFLLSSSAAVLYAFGIRPQLLHTQARQRVDCISRRLPYAVDLAALMMGAGGTPREALEMMAQQKEEPLAEEFTQALAQMQGGSPQSKALLAMARRIELEDLTALVLAINRGESTGAPLAKALETQAEVFRFRRLQRAERLAVEAPVKMMFPNMLIMLAVLILVLGPVLVKLGQDGLI